MNAFDYFFKANLYGLLFAGCYYLLLRRHTFLHLNRAYLLVSVLLTLTLPLVSLTPDETQVLPVAMPVGVIMLPVMAAAPVGVSQEVAGPDRVQLLPLIYALVSLAFLARMGWRIWQVSQLIRRSARRQYRGFTLVLPTTDTVATFSFCHYVVLSPADANNGLVLQHEQVHVRQWHSADVLGMAILQALFWAVPVLWLLDRALRQVHEFLADQGTVQQVTQPTQYAQFLVDYAFGVRPEPLTNGFFNPTLLKQRIQMIQRRATTRWALGKYMLLLPLSLSLLAMTSVPRELEALVDKATGEPITVQGRVTSAADGKPLQGVSVMDGDRLARSDKNSKPVLVHYQTPIRSALERTASSQKLRPVAPADTVPKSGKLWRPVRDYPDYSTNKDRYNLPLPDSLRLLTPPSATVRISTLSKEDPLFVVDGIPLEKDKMRGAVNPNNIESISVLKDGAATTAYGEKGKNGVIFIKTKKP